MFANSMAVMAQKKAYCTCTPFQFESSAMSITEHETKLGRCAGVELFTGFTSPTYDGVMLEAKNWIQPLLDNQALQKSFLTYSKSPRLKQKLETLLNYLQELRDALNKQENPPKNTNSALSPVISKLADFWSTQLDEVSALLIATQGFLEFSPGLLKGLKKLPLVKRNMLLELIRITPCGSSEHVYLDEGPYTDEDLYPILIQLGFSVHDHQHLMYNAVFVRNQLPNHNQTLISSFIQIICTHKHIILHFLLNIVGA